MSKCYVKVFICDEIDGCEIVTLCGLRDNEEMAIEADSDIFNFLKEKLGAGAFECLLEVEIIGTSSFNGEHTEWDVDYSFALVDYEHYPAKESDFRITTGIIRADDIMAFKEEAE